MGAMSYVQHVLQPNETLIYVTRLHWLVYARATFFLILAALLAALGVYGIDDWVPQRYIFYAAGLVAAVAVLAFVLAAIRRATTEYAVTDHRIIHKRGILARHTIEMVRNKVESVDVVQSFMGRVFNYGTILVRGTGSTLEPFRFVENPLRFRSAITAQ
jgi:uncharacterized membrane protein YdbT with pleckstrin-like domain